jgi:hypothetical protein
MPYYVLAHDPYNPIDGNWMQFRLTYTGPLFASQENDSRSRHKQEIRKVFHKQLKSLWNISPILKSYNEGKSREVGKPVPEYLAEQYAYNGYNFVPLLVPKLFLLCNIGVLFLRPEEPGSVIQSGDLDNRLKTIFDALRMPKTKAELGGYDAPESGENPFYCLLPEDRLISGVSVETDTLLEISDAHTMHDAKLIITVNLKPYKSTLENLTFGAG